jgi:hypothetical protein
MHEDMALKEQALLEVLRGKIREGNLTLGDLEGAVREMERSLLELLDLLDRSRFFLEGQDQARVQELQMRLGRVAYGVLFDQIRRLAWKLRGKEPGLRKDVYKSGYRLINLARAGRRDEVAYLLTRIFLAQEQVLPHELVRIFSPAVPDDIFRACVYAFVGILGGKTSEDSDKKEGGEA